MKLNETHENLQFKYDDEHDTVTVTDTTDGDVVVFDKGAWDAFNSFALQVTIAQALALTFKKKQS